jgi:hypothetical protein
MVPDFVGLFTKIFLIGTSLSLPAFFLGWGFGSGIISLQLLIIIVLVVFFGVFFGCQYLK